MRRRLLNLLTALSLLLCVVVGASWVNAVPADATTPVPGTTGIDSVREGQGATPAGI